MSFLHDEDGDGHTWDEGFGMAADTAGGLLKGVGQGAAFLGSAGFGLGTGIGLAGAGAMATTAGASSPLSIAAIIGGAGLAGAGLGLGLAGAGAVGLGELLQTDGMGGVAEMAGDWTNNLLNPPPVDRPPSLADVLVPAEPITEPDVD